MNSFLNILCPVFPKFDKTLIQMKRHYSILLAALAILVAACQPSDPTIVKTTNGLVQGHDEEGTLAFKGIPYARVERCMPPLPVEPWDTVMVCQNWGPQVMQSTREELPESVMSEKNSCVLNVWTTDTKAKKPVMLWIHGGGFDSGSGAGNPGMGLAKKDVVLVSLNHRLNILGFLDLSQFGEKYKESNMVGMLDIVAALQWIQDNIAAFGGDPGNVTIFGESGGGGKVGTLMCMPAAKGLFHKAIIMSGTILNINTKAMTEELGAAVLDELGIPAEEVDRIADVPYRELYAAGQRAMAKSIGTRTPGTPMMWGFGPAPDGEILLQQPFQPDFASISNDVPLMIGTTFNELQRHVYNIKEMSFDEAKTMLEPVFTDLTDDLIAAFKEAYPERTPQDLVSMDRMFRPKTLITTDAIAGKREAPMYVYMFNTKSPVDGNSSHGSELAFCFNTLHLSPRQVPEPSEDDLRVADLMSQSWANFAATGNPNAEGLPQWAPYTPDNKEMLIYDYKCEVKKDFDRKIQEIMNARCFKQLDAWNAK